VADTKTKQYHQLEEEKVKAQTLTETLEAKRNFVRHISHEIRTPLNIVASGLELLLKFRESLTAEMLDIVFDVKQACGVAIETLNEVLTYEKVDGNLLVLEKGPEDILLLLQSVFRMFQVQAKALNISMALDIGSDISSVIVNVDAPKIAQVIRNLMSNALKFTPANGSVTVKLTVNKTSQVVRIEVLDTGVGMEKEDRAKLFNEVVQFHAKELQGGGGSGLGLFLSKKVVEMHAGKIGVDLERDSPGSLFYLELQVVSVFSSKSDEDMSGRRSSLSLKSFRPMSFRAGACKGLSKARVLVVDDAALIRKFHIRMMQADVGEFVEASDGDEAIDNVKESLSANKPFNGILIDANMPRMNGVDAVRAIRQLGYEGKIFAVTGDAFDSAKDAFFAEGADEVFVKPITAVKYSYMVALLQ
jgi:CheY-like chemotaxis protein